MTADFDQSELAELYQDMVLDHGRSPHNHRAIEGADRTAEGYNPLCGDRVTVYLSMDGETIADASFLGSACAICTASSSMLTRAVKGSTASDALALFEAFHDLLTTEDPPDLEFLGPLSALAGVRRFPIRVKCATLPWHTLKAALDQKHRPATTE